MTGETKAAGADLKGLLIGLFFLALGIAAIVLSRAYTIGTASDMGAGYFPSLIGWLMVPLSLLQIMQARPWQLGLRLEKLHVMPAVIIILALLVFAFLVERAGLAIALPAMVFVAALASGNRRWMEVVWMAIGMTVFTIVVFVKIFGVILPIWPGGAP